MKRRIVLLGPPASGKGTQADMLKSRFSLSTACLGVMLREESLAGSELGLESERLTTAGRLVPHQAINEVVSTWLERQPSDGFVFDGYPRTVGQAEALDTMLAARGTSLDVAVLLGADILTMRIRVEKRLTCGACGNIASLDQVGSPGERCGGGFSCRRDDNAETLKVRVEEYLDKTAPVAGYYERSHLLSRVESSGSREQVFAEVCRALAA